MSDVCVVGAAILKGDTCLVAQRGPEMSLPGQWEFPGGKVEIGDVSPMAALKREIAEELGLKVAVGESLGRGTSIVNGRQIVLEVFACQIVSGRVQLTEHRAYGWFRASAFDYLDWAKADQPIAQNLRKLLPFHETCPRPDSGLSLPQRLALQDLRELGGFIDLDRFGRVVMWGRVVNKTFEVLEREGFVRRGVWSRTGKEGYALALMLPTSSGEAEPGNASIQPPECPPGRGHGLEGSASPEDVDVAADGSKS